MGAFQERAPLEQLFDLSQPGALGNVEELATMCLFHGGQAPFESAPATLVRLHTRRFCAVHLLPPDLVEATSEWRRPPIQVQRQLHHSNTFYSVLNWYRGRFAMEQSALTQLDIDNHPVAALLCELCAGFYNLGWNVGTGGGVSVQEPDSDLIFLSPSGVHKERMKPADLFVYHVGTSGYVYKPSGKRPSASSAIFLWLHEHHGARSVIHTHSLYANLATKGEIGWTISDQEYIKGIPRYDSGVMLSNTDQLFVPVIDNQATEDRLLPDLRKALDVRPEAACVLVKNHGAYHFGRDIWKCKAQAECLEYLFELSFRMAR